MAAGCLHISVILLNNYCFRLKTGLRHYAWIVFRRDKSAFYSPRHYHLPYTVPNWACSLFYLSKFVSSAICNVECHLYLDITLSLFGWCVFPSLDRLIRLISLLIQFKVSLSLFMELYIYNSTLSINPAIPKAHF